MCFEDDRVRTNEQIVVSGLRLETITALILAGYKLKGPDKITMTDDKCVNCDFLEMCKINGNVLPTNTNKPGYIRGLNSMCFKTLIRYSWKDFVKIGDDIYFEESFISGKQDSVDVYQIDEFIEFVAKKYDVDVDNIHLWTMEHFEMPVEILKHNISECGLYINGIPEWIINKF